MVNVPDIVITSLETIDAFDITTGAYLFTLDELQNASIANTLDKTDITGKGGRKLSSLKRNKAATISGASGIVSGGLLEMQTGSDLESKATKVMWVDHLTVDANHKAVTKYVGVGTGKQIVDVYIRNNDGTLGERFEQGNSAAPAGTDSETGLPTLATFTYTPDTTDHERELTFDSTVTNGTEIVVYYYRKITAGVLENDSGNYSKKAALYVNAFGEDKCANVYRIQFFIPKADFNGEFTFEMGDNQTVQNFEAEALSGACGANGALWTYTVFGKDAADVA